jgi:nucleotide-binding universal stress UspA family protein
MYRTILAGFDGSEGAKIALKEAAEFGKLLGAKVTALWVQHALPHYPETVGEIEEEKHAASAFLSKITRDVAAIEKEVKYPIACKHEVGHPASTLLKFAEIGKYDLIVLGHSGHSRLWGRVLGHTADRVSEHADCNVLIVRRPIAANSKRKPSE